MLKLALSILVFLLLPSFIKVTYQEKSLAPGLILVATLHIYLYMIIKAFNVRFNRNLIVFVLLALLFLFLFSIKSLLIYGETKPIFSCLGLSVLFLCAYFYSSYLLSLSFSQIHKALVLTISVLLILGWIGVFYKPYYFNYQLYPKAVFPFSEHSHYALSIGFLILCYNFIGSKKINIFFNIQLFLLSVIFPNLTLLIFFILSLLVYAIRFFKPTTILFAFFNILLSFYFVLKIPYFYDRINVLETSNLSALVWLQGWELIILNWWKYLGFGLGFQMLGSKITSTGYFSGLIQNILQGSMLNLQDGGFLASKVIAEFGIIGIVISITYIYFIIKLLLDLRKYYSKNISFSLKKKLLFKAFLFSFVVEYFFRGYGYFSPQLFFVLVAIFSLYNNRFNKIHKNQNNKVMSLYFGKSQKRKNLC